jgi:hypothetical protein
MEAAVAEFVGKPPGSVAIYVASSLIEGATQLTQNPTATHCIVYPPSLVPRPDRVETGLALYLREVGLFVEKFGLEGTTDFLLLGAAAAPPTPKPLATLFSAVSAPVGPFAAVVSRGFAEKFLAAATLAARHAPERTEDQILADLLSLTRRFATLPLEHDYFFTQTTC